MSEPATTSPLHQPARANDGTASPPLQAHTQRPDNLAPLADRQAVAGMTSGEIMHREMLAEREAAWSVVHRRNPDGGVTIEPRNPADRPSAPQPADDATKVHKFGEMEFTEGEMREFMLAKSAQANLPATPQAYEAKLPEGLKLPGDVKFEIDEQDPALADARAFAHRHKFTPQQFSEMLGLHAMIQAREASSFDTARRAEVAKLGVNGTQRVDAIETWTRGMIGDKHAGAIRGMMVTAGIVEALELLQSKFASQGAANFSQQHRVPPEQQGRVSDEQWGKMSGAERLDYARGFDQSQFAGAR